MDIDTTLAVFTGALHRRTGAPRMDCHRALVECGMDFELARQAVAAMEVVRLHPPDPGNAP